MTRQTLVAGNWKMNGSGDSIVELMSGLRSGLDQMGSRVPQVLVFPPSVYLKDVVGLCADSPIGCGAQDVAVQASGAHTGDVSAAMLTDIGCTHVLVGHSERRADHGESSQQVARKAQAALAAGLTPILCCGETLADRESGRTEQVVGEQLDAALSLLDEAALAELIVAYEPVWAIGTGKTASADQAQQVHAFIRNKFAAINDTIADRLIILYGGSVKGANAAELFSQPDIDGGLIGGASLTAEQFLPICQAGA